MLILEKHDGIAQNIIKFQYHNDVHSVNLVYNFGILIIYKLPLF